LNKPIRRSAARRRLALAAAGQAHHISTASWRLLGQPR
jgi:hypothetical protein